MLTLTRKPGQAIFIGENITVEISRIKGNQVVVNIGAPEDVLILRDELLCRESDFDLHDSCAS